MNTLELTRPDGFFMEVGRKSFRLGVHFMDNPYKSLKQKDLWARGYKQEERKFKRQPKYRWSYYE